VLFGRVPGGGLHLQMCTTRKDLHRLDGLRNAGENVVGEEERDEDDNEENEEYGAGDDQASANETRREAAEQDGGNKGAPGGPGDLSDGGWTMYPSGMLSPSDDLSKTSSIDVDAWKFATFSSSLWLDFDGNMQLTSKGSSSELEPNQGLTRPKEWFGSLRREKAQFAERFNVIRGMPHLSGKTENKLEKYVRSLPCDDISSESDNFLSVFDGVGELGKSAGKFARQLANNAEIHSRINFPAKDRPPATVKDNWSNQILDVAHRDTVRRWNREWGPGASTAVVLSLTSCSGASGRTHTLHECVYGDSRWVLLRKQGERYACVYLSHEMHYNARQRNPPPMQLTSSTTRLHEGSAFYCDFKEVQEDDVVIMGSDGLFDNLVGQKAADRDQTLKSWVENAVQETCERCKDGCEVCKVMRDEGGGHRIPVLCIGEHLQREASKNMESGDPATGRFLYKPDDLAITVSRISMGTLPDLTKQTCKKMRVSAAIPNSIFEGLVVIMTVMT